MNYIWKNFLPALSSKSRGFRRLLWVGVAFFVVSMITRVVLALFFNESFTFLQWLNFMGIGIIFDLTIVPWFLLPWGLYDALVPELPPQHRFSKLEGLWASGWGITYLTIFCVIAVAEFTFWAEFAGRFDFIAVDYLIYTDEVIGNIMESYPVPLWTFLIVCICGAVTWFSWPRHNSSVSVANWGIRWSRFILVGFSMLLGWWFVNTDIAETNSNRYVQQLSNNGLFAFGHAYFNNELDYETYYPVLDDKTINTEIRELVKQPDAQFTSDDGIERIVKSTNAKKDINIVLLTIESFSAKYMGYFGNTENLTPEMDALAHKGLFFTNLYATGTRTVRGLEALSVGTPPTPGQSIVRRPKNENLETLGNELKIKGWNPFWIYGGYGFFDNMNAYFGGNGYEIIDRTDAENEKIKIHSENIWGIADEDLYSLAMVTLDRQHAKGERFFAQIMTTSNHRPYTFPENRIDMPMDGHSKPAVKYTDWAVGDFIRRASKKPWFDNTLFVIIADHTAKSAGMTDLPPDRYHIPMLWYAPKLIETGTMDRLMSQIDVPTTLMSWLGLDYTSRFFGFDMFNLEQGRERAFISTYQKLGYMKAGKLVVLDVKKDPIITDGVKFDTDPETPPTDERLAQEAISWYQAASHYFRTGALGKSAD